jgi:hypothetical protein
MLMGAVIITFPFCTPETVRKLGYKKSANLAIFCGMGLELMGIFLIFFL